MQINGAQFAAVIYPKTSEFQQKTRTPVVIDVKPIVESGEKALHQTSRELSLYPQAITTYDTQQPRFARLLSTTEQSSNNNSVNQPTQQLPRSVQQYLQVADSTSEPSQRLFDEIV